jgi:hypothetical protein
MTTSAERQKAPQEFSKTHDILLLKKRLGQKNIKSTLNLLGRTGAFKISTEEQQ